jgi:hypothetical protein
MVNREESKSPSRHGGGLTINTLPQFNLRSFATVALMVRHSYALCLDKMLNSTLLSVNDDSYKGGEGI